MFDKFFFKVAQSFKEEHQQPANAQGTDQFDQSQTQSGQSSSQSLSTQLTFDKSNERKVTIIGPPEAQWKAQFMIFRKVGYEGLSVPQEATLTVEIMVPSSQVGRIIGKGGSVVRELQRLTHAVIKLPEESQSSSEETPVHIIGDFLSTQVNIKRIILKKKNVFVNFPYEILFKIVYDFERKNIFKIKLDDFALIVNSFLFKIKYFDFI